MLCHDWISSLSSYEAHPVCELMRKCQAESESQGVVVMLPFLPPKQGHNTPGTQSEYAAMF